MLYCIEIHRELEEVMIQHHSFDHEPVRQEVLDFIDTLDCGYNDDYGKIRWYRVN